MLYQVVEQHERQWHKFVPMMVWAPREVPNSTTGTSPYMFVYGQTPSVCHLGNKLDDSLAQQYKPSIIRITESWLNVNNSDSSVNLRSYNIFRKDRTKSSGGGLAIYVSVYSALPSVFGRFDCNDFEIPWVLLRPKQLPRPLSCLLIAVVYCPPSYDVAAKKKLSSYIIDSCDKLLKKYPNAGVFFVGNFNTLQTNYFNRHLNLVQIDNASTRGKHILDKIFTNSSSFYAPPIILSPVGKSDHNCVFVKPKCYSDYHTATTNLLLDNDCHQVFWFSWILLQLQFTTFVGKIL